MTMIFDPTATAANPNTGIEGTDAVNAALSSWSLKLDVAKPNFAVADDAITGDAVTNSPGSPARSAYALRADGLFYRTNAPVVLKLLQTDGGSNVPIAGALMSLPQAGPVSYIPMHSSAFVKTVDTVQFTDGSLTSWSAERPSEVLEIVRLPVKVLSSVVSVAAQIVSVKVDYSTKTKALLDAQKAQMQADADRAKLLGCLAAAQKTNSDGTECFK